METLNQLIQAISTVGFPIIMCLILFWYVKYQNDTHTEELSKLREAVDKVSELITKMCDRIDFIEKENSNER